MEKDKLFFRDSPMQLTKSYEDFWKDLLKIDSFNPYFKEPDFYNIFLNLTYSLIKGEELTIFDSDFSDEEVANLLGNDLEINSNVKQVNPLDISFLDFINSINPQFISKDWSITLFTSGTTGKPKKITHTIKSILRGIRVDNKFSNDTWGFAYNPTHIAGIQVFFQALFNFNSIVRLFNLEKKVILDEIESNSITNISATPSFYRLLLPTKNSFPSVKRITSGGESFDKQLLQYVNGSFPQAKIRNVYASTEAGTIFASEGDIFFIKESQIGFVKIQNQELLIHKELLGKSDSLKLDGNWYHTGDLVEEIQPGVSFKFKSRKDKMINVGGYNVNPEEVEGVMRSIPEIKEALVYAKKNSVLGSLVYADVIPLKDLSENSIRSFLSEKLQEHKIPRIIRFVESFEYTRTGKIKRS